MQNHSPDIAYPADEKRKQPSPRNSPRKHALVAFAAVIAAVVCLDALTKSWAYTSLPKFPVTIIPGFFNLSYGENTGIAFGLFQEHGRFLTFLSPLAFLGLGAYLGWYVWRSGRLSIAVACGMIMGGAFGNVWSRLADGYVVDFFDFQLGGYHWPAFNVADSSLCCGVVLFLFLSTRHPSTIYPQEREACSD